MKPVFTAIASLCLAVPAYAQSQDAPLQMNMEMTPNMVRLLNVDRPISNIVIGSADVADTTILGTQSLSITAGRTGETSILILDDESGVIAALEVSVVPSSRGLNRRPVVVRTFGSGKGDYEAHSYYCGSSTGCDFDQSKGNKTAAPSISTDPIIADGNDSPPAER